MVGGGSIKIQYSVCKKNHLTLFHIVKLDKEFTHCIHNGKMPRPPLANKTKWWRMVVRGFEVKKSTQIGKFRFCVNV